MFTADDLKSNYTVRQQNKPYMKIVLVKALDVKHVVCLEDVARLQVVYGKSGLQGV